MPQPSLPLFSDFTSLVKRIDALYSHPALNISFPSALARSNGLMGEAETKLVNEGVDEVEALLEEISSARQQIDALGAFMDAQKGPLEAMGARYRALIAPIRKVPFEVLQEIFMFVHDLEDRHKQGSPPAVAQVNQYWRNVALATPLLWSAVLLPFNPRNVSDRIEELGLRMRRSVGQGVSLSITSTHTSEYAKVEVRDATIALTEEIMPYTSRLGALAVKVTQKPAYSAFLDVCQASPVLNFAALKRLRLDLNLMSRPKNQLCSAIQKICQSAPNLENLYIPDLDAQHCVNIRWNTLKAFRGSVDVTNAITLFRSSGPVEGLDVALKEARPPIPNPPYLPLLNLTTLSIRGLRFWPPNVWPPFPALRHLIMHGCRNLDRDAILAIAQAWGSNLSYISLPETGNAVYAGDYLQSCFALMSKLEAVRVQDTAIILRVLTDSQAFDLPRLSHIEVDLTSGGDDLLEVRTFCSCVRQGYVPHISSLTLLLDSEDERFDAILNLVNREGPRFSLQGITLSLVDSATHGFLLDSPYLRRAGVLDYWDDKCGTSVQLEK